MHIINMGNLFTKMESSLYKKQYYHK